MAIVQYGPTVTGIRGTIGGITFSANHTANYCKQWSKPPYKRSLKQVQTRGSMVTNSVLWTDLADATKTDWNDFAAAPNELDYDPWGTQRFLSGFQWFARAQQRRTTLALANPGDVPSGAAEVAVTGVVIACETGSGGTSTITYDDDQFLDDQALILYMTFTPSQGAADAWRNWKLIEPNATPPNGGYSIHDAWYTAFGDISAGWKAWAMVYKQALAGNRSVLTAANCIVSA